MMFPNCLTVQENRIKPQLTCLGGIAMGKELFDNIPSKVADLLSDVKNGRIGLPDLQRNMLVDTEIS